jgi:hypothetical protein
MRLFRRNRRHSIDYFEDNVPDLKIALCSDRDCPCSPETRIPRSTGFLYVSQEVVAFRRDARTRQDLQKKAARLAERLPFAEDRKTVMAFGSGVVGPVLVCERGARLRKLDLEVAAADARHWWKTGLVPLRPTPTVL